MKKVLLVLGIILVALSIMAPGSPDKAEKLKVEDQDYDMEPFFYIDGSTGEFIYGVDISGIDCKFGLATAGEHADFKIGVNISGVKRDLSGWTYDWTEFTEVGFMKDPNDTKDEEGYIGILTDEVSWNGDDDGNGYFVNEIALTLIGPSGAPMGDAIYAPEGGVLINNPDKPSVKVDDHDWDYSPESNAIVVPLLADDNIVDFLTIEGYRVTVDVEVKKLDGTLAGTGRGSADIVKVEDQDFDYVQIQPVSAALTSEEWNGDDDGTHIVSGSIELVDFAGNIVSTTFFEDEYVLFGILLCEDCAPGET